MLLTRVSGTRANTDSAVSKSAMLPAQTARKSSAVVSWPVMRRCSTRAGNSSDCDSAAIDTVARSQAYYLDVTPPGADKGTFVDAMAKRLGISHDAIATIGDGGNDVAMFRKAGLSIAMGNAAPEVKQQANCVTGSNEEDGFASAIERYILASKPEENR